MELHAVSYTHLDVYKRQRQNRPSEKHKCAHNRNEGRDPVARSARKKKRRQKLHGHDDFGAQEENHLERSFPSPEREEDYRPSGDRCDQDEPEAREKTECQRSSTGLHMEPRSNFGFERFQMVVDAASGRAAQLAVHPVKVGEEQQNSRKKQNAGGVEKNGHARDAPAS